MPTLEFTDGRLRLIDQTRLPDELVYVECSTLDSVAEAITSMRVRGAPALGVAGAYGLLVGLFETAEKLGAEPGFDAIATSAERIAERLRSTRPTAVNLAWAVDGGLECLRQTRPSTLSEATRALRGFADALAETDVRTNQRIGAHGADLIPDGANVLTHCNTGALATVDYGTALGVIRAATERGRHLHVWVDETRPFLQGARLTAWELAQLGIPMTLITDSMAGHFMAQGKVDLVIVGADRIAANGDVANKIGTYSLAVLSAAHGIPFYVAAPTSTIDLGVESGSEIPIEERHPREVTHFAGHAVAPEGVAAAHPAFDVTPARLVSAIITERGVLYPPFDQSLAAATRAASVGSPAEVAR